MTDVRDYEEAAKGGLRKSTDISKKNQRTEETEAQRSTSLVWRNLLG